MVDNCSPEMQALTAAQRAQADAVSALSKAKSDQQKAANEAKKAQNSIADEQQTIAGYDERINNDTNAVLAATGGGQFAKKGPLHSNGEFSADYQRDLKAGVQAYRDDIEKYRGLVALLDADIKKSEEVIKAKDTADAAVKAAEKAVDDNQGKVNAAQKALDACRKKQVPVSPPVLTSTGSTTTSQVTSTTGSTATQTVTSPGDTSSSTASTTTPATPALPDTVTVVTPIPGTTNNLVSFNVPLAAAQTFFKPEEILMPNTPSTETPPTYTSQFYNPALGGLVGPKTIPPPSGTTSYNIPGSNFTSGTYTPNLGFSTNDVMVTGNVSPVSGTGSSIGLDATFNVGSE